MPTTHIYPEIHEKIHIIEWVLDMFTWGTHSADERGCEALSSPEDTRNRPELMKNNARGNEPRHVWTLVKASGIIRDNIWHHESS